jgi:SAM-dependent methyltransferase
MSAEYQCGGRMTTNRTKVDDQIPMPGSSQGETRQSSSNDDSDDFYAAFEARFRGTREEITRRQSVYLPVLEKAEVLRSDAPVLDIGCGRGEWLELLGQHGCNARGIDLSEKFVFDCVQKGLDVVHMEACEFLRSQPAETYSAVTSFHLVEHLPFALLRELIGEIHRVLRPGGIMILETPNPENISVGAYMFYYDPSHLAPLPPGLLQFVTEQAGFPGPQIAHVNADAIGAPLPYVPNEAVHSLQVNAAIHLLNQSFFCAPDYSIIAQKAGGIRSINESAEMRYLNEQTQKGITEFRQLAAEAKAQDAEAKARDAEAKAQDAEAKAQGSEAKAQDAEARERETIGRLEAVLNSNSWHLTLPIRLVLDLLKKSAGRLKSYIFLPKRATRKAVRVVGRKIRSHTVMARASLAILNRFPALKKRIRTLVIAQPTFSSAPMEQKELGEGAQRVLADLKRIMKKNSLDNEI